MTKQFIWNTKLFYLIFWIHLYSVRLALKVGNLFPKKHSRCPHVFIQEFYSKIHAISISIPQFTTIFWGTRIVVTPNLITNVLHVPKVACSDYPSHPHLRSISQDELASHFCERPMLQGDALNFTTHEFAKALRILNMVMTFVLNP